MHRPSICLPKKNTLHGTNISLLGKGNSSSKLPFFGDMLVPCTVHLTLEKKHTWDLQICQLQPSFFPWYFFHQTCKLDPRSNCPEQWWEWLWCHALHTILGVLVYQKMGGSLRLLWVMDSVVVSWALLLAGCLLFLLGLGFIPKLKFEHCQWMAVVTNSCLLTISCWYTGPVWFGIERLANMNI